MVWFGERNKFRSIFYSQHQTEIRGLRLECDLTVTQNASERKCQFPRLHFGLLSNAKVREKASALSRFNMGVRAKRCAGVSPANRGLMRAGRPRTNPKF